MVQQGYLNVSLTPEAKRVLASLAGRLTEKLGRRVSLSEAIVLAEPVLKSIKSPTR